MPGITDVLRCRVNWRRWVAFFITGSRDRCSGRTGEFCSAHFASRGMLTTGATSGPRECSSIFWKKKKIFSFTAAGEIERLTATLVVVLRGTWHLIFVRPPPPRLLSHVNVYTYWNELLVPAPQSAVKLECVIDCHAQWTCSMALSFITLLSPLTSEFLDLKYSETFRIKIETSLYVSLHQLHQQVRREFCFIQRKKKQTNNSIIIFKKFNKNRKKRESR